MLIMIGLIENNFSLLFQFTRSRGPGLESFSSFPFLSLSECSLLCPNSLEQTQATDSSPEVMKEATGTGNYFPYLMKLVVGDSFTL